MVTEIYPNAIHHFTRRVHSQCVRAIFARWRIIHNKTLLNGFWKWSRRSRSLDERRAAQNAEPHSM